jgi:hypothetical protein
MALVIANRVQETTTTTGTGTVTLAGAVAGFQSFAVVGNGNTTYYTITSGTAWEVGIGTYSTTGPTLARTTILSSSAAGAAITLVGTSTVFSSYPAEKVISDGYGLLPVANGGTGATTLTANNVLLGNGTSAVQVVAPGTNGNVLVSNGTTWASAAMAAGITFTNVKTSNYTAAVNDGVQTDTTAGSFTVTLPATPATGAQVIITDAADTWATNNLTVGRNGSTIEGVALDLICNVSGVAITLIYTGTTWQVFAQAGGAGGSADINTQTTGTLLVSRGGTGATTLTANAVVIGNGTSAVTTVSPSTTGNVLTSNGTTWISQAGVAAASVQTFSSSGTWTKPTGAQFVLVEAWGAGGGGSRPATSTSGGAGTIRIGSGGGGGAYNFQLFLASSLGSTEVVTVGAGGLGGITNNSNGNNGGSTDFGQKVFGFGGAQGVNGAFGGGGGGISASSTGTTPGGPRIGTNQTQNMAGGYGGTTADRAGGASAYGGGGGGAGDIATTAFMFTGGGNSVYGAGGGSPGTSYRVIGGGTAFIYQGFPGLGGSSAASSLVQQSVPLFGQSGAAYSGGAGGSYYDFPSFAMTNFNDVGVVSSTIVASSANNGAEVAVVGTANYIPFVFTSSNGTATYTSRPVPLGYYQNNFGILWDGSKYVLFFNRIITTTDFTTFTTVASSSLPSISSANRFAYVNNIYFILNTTNLFSSSDLTSWVSASVNGVTNVDARGVAFNGTEYYVAALTAVYKSSNLTSWTLLSSGVTTGAIGLAASAAAVVVGNSVSPFARRSTNGGSTWANIATVLPAQPTYIVYIASQNRWFLNSNNVLYTSTDGNTWATAGISLETKNVLWNGTVFCATARNTSSDEVQYTSATGTSAWTARTTAAILTATGQAGGAGGLGGGGGGAGGAATTTTGNGGNGGSGYCRVYTW